MITVFSLTPGFIQVWQVSMVLRTVSTVFHRPAKLLKQFPINLARPTTPLFCLLRPIGVNGALTTSLLSNCTPSEGRTA